ncbi:hypothetical protein IF1G_07688 [Cordyceps javanica]|uniref:Uncharacterized protein n=1 Tax=Cordyceps javanica TaxID=43265 RepID=A0A545UWX2_9HYPO|nr:hypothetical protein IF1G_07688 [Cordyceps javanica]
MLSLRHSPIYSTTAKRGANRKATRKATNLLAWSRPHNGPPASCTGSACLPSCPSVPDAVMSFTGSFDQLWPVTT